LKGYLATLSGNNFMYIRFYFCRALISQCGEFTGTVHFRTLPRCLSLLQANYWKIYFCQTNFRCNHNSQRMWSMRGFSEKRLTC